MPKKNVMIALCGIFPQVITETLYALNIRGISIDLIHILTTNVGKKAIIDTLLHPKKPIIEEYIKEFRGLDSFPTNNSTLLREENIHVCISEEQVEMSDIYSEVDNQLFLEKCLEITKKFTDDEATTVYFSIAGGRKTMTSCLTIAAQIFGRKQDRIFHVLVPREFESNKDFFFPKHNPPKVQVKKQLRSNKAEISLIHLPFISLKENSTSLTGGMIPDIPDSLVNANNIGLPQLIVSKTEPTVKFGTLNIQFQPVQAAFLLMHALKRKNCKVQNCPPCTDCGYEHKLASNNTHTPVYDLYLKEFIELKKRMKGSRVAEPLSTFVSDWTDLLSRVNFRLPGNKCSLKKVSTDSGGFIIFLDYPPDLIEII